ncbi:MAG TPA: hypothetical protein VJN62_05150 [Gemmatimonadales bacterium]|nr:hypothetical protein [Gemmatimonadales bacterium]
MRVLARHPLAWLLLILVIVSAFFPLPPIVDAVTGAVPGDAALTRPALYVLLAPISNTLDALTFLTIERAQVLLGTWIILIALWGVLAGRTRRGRLIRVLLAPVIVFLFAGAAVTLPRPVPALESADSDATIIDFHSHTQASHDGRRGWTADDLARWHADQGFQAAYVTDHNVTFPGRQGGPIPLLPGVEWSVYRQHIVALGRADSIDREAFSKDTPGMLKLFATLHQQGVLAIASIPEYWENHREDLEQFVTAGVDGFEIVNCAPKALRFSSGDRADVLLLARNHDLLVTGASDNHGWGKVTCVWNLSQVGARGFRANEVIARPLALAQGNDPVWIAGFDQPWLMLRSLTAGERTSWLTWIAVYLIYMSVPRRKGKRASIGILARDLTPSRD